jgi:hypothetical protein
MNCYLVSDLINPLASITTTGLWFGLFIFGFSFYNTHQSWLTERVEAQIKKPTENIWTVYTNDNAVIGEIKEEDLLIGQYYADKCYITKLKQLGNVAWIAWSVFMRSITGLAGYIVMFLLFVERFMTIEEINNVNLGEIVSSGILWKGVAVLMCFYIMICVLSRGFQRLPGYKNYYEITLRRQLSKNLKNIANANGFTIKGVKFKY